MITNGEAEIPSDAQGDDLIGEVSSPEKGEAIVSHPPTLSKVRGLFATLPYSEGVVAKGSASTVMLEGSFAERYTLSVAF